uniref:Uncharacterized protein n=1 Tax=Meloidogyne floridensis TaxID=298350 RepID=A0A915PBQ8_9BILA
MYRKRGGSLEQELVMSSPISTGTSADPYPFSNYNGHNQLKFPSEGCITRVPFSSLSAFLFCLGGILLFKAMIMWAFNATIEQIRRSLGITQLPWLDKFQLLLIIACIAMFVISAAFLLIGILSTGQTREHIFRQMPRSRRGGRIFCILAICLASLLNLLWIIILALTAIMCFIYSIFSVLCTNIGGNTSTTRSCLDFNSFKPLFFSSDDNRSLQFCEGQLQQFCALTNTVVIWYFVGLFGALIICFGLLQFIASNSANYAHIGNEARYDELLAILNSEMACENYHCRKPHKFPSQENDRSRPSYNTADYYSQKFDYNLQQFPHENYRNDVNYSTAPPVKPRLKPRQQNQNIGHSTKRHSYQSSLNGSNNWLNGTNDQKWKEEFRPKSKVEKLAERQQWILSFNHNDFDNRRLQNDDDDQVYAEGVNKKLKRKTAKAEMEELFKDLDGEEFEEEEDLTDFCDKYNEDGADNEGGDNVSVQSSDYDINQDGNSSKNLESLYDNENERLASDDDVPPEEFSSNLHGNTKVDEQISKTKFQNENSHRKKASKKKRDAIKQKKLMETDNGVYRVQKGVTQFEIVSLDKRNATNTDNESETDEEDEGSLMCSSSFIPLDDNNKINKNRKVLAPPNIGFREQLLRISTANKRKKRR